MSCLNRGTSFQFKDGNKSHIKIVIQSRQKLICKASGNGSNGSNVLFTPLQLGEIEIPHRVIMAPCTRNRADDDLAPQEIARVYYEQRAKNTFLITEAVQVCQEGLGYTNNPGIYTDKQTQGWKRITESVHAQNGIIFMQLYHVGRASHSYFQPGNKPPSSSSELPIKDFKINVPGMGEIEFETPRSLSIPEIKETIEYFRKGAENAKAAGFDGVEIHGAHGYLINQFLDDNCNKRTDEYGGSLENRCRFLIEIVEALVSVWPSGRVGARFSPAGRIYDMKDSNLEELYTYIFKKLDGYNLAYLHVSEPRFLAGQDANDNNMKLTSKFFKGMVKTPVLAAGGYDAKTAEEHVRNGEADGIAFGRFFISNPDLPERIKNGVEFNKYNRDLFYDTAAGPKGYIDYPFMDSKVEALV